MIKCNWCSIVLRYDSQFNMIMVLSADPCRSVFLRSSLCQIIMSQHHQHHHQQQQNDLILAIQPTLMFGLFQHWYSRSLEECPNRCVGALLGTRDAHDSVFDAVHSFAVQHEERGDQIGINCDQFRAWMALHKQVHGKRSVLLGWFSIQAGGSLIISDASNCEKPVPTSQEDTSVDAAQPSPLSEVFQANTLFINEFFAQEVKESSATNSPCVFLSVTVGDGSGVDGGIQFKAFVSGSDVEGVGGYHLEPIQHVIHSHDSMERRILGALRRNLSVDHVSDSDISIPLSQLGNMQVDELEELQRSVDALRQVKTEEVDHLLNLLPDQTVLDTIAASIKEESQLISQQADLVLAALSK